MKVMIKAHKHKEKYECHLCGVYYWVEDRDDFDCPNCTNES